MPIFTRNGRRFLYLHVPKTGGSTIEAWLRDSGPLQFHSVGVPVALRCAPQHLRMSDFRELFGDLAFEHVFMTVRNPYDRIASEYRMRAMLSGQGFWKAWPNFSHWLEVNLASTSGNPFILDNHLRPQWQFYGTGVEVLRYENGIKSILSRISEVTGLKPPELVPHIYETTTSGIEVNFDEVDRIRVQEFYRKDFDLFGYDF